MEKKATTDMKIVYVENVRMPSERAHAYQIVQMCANWAQQGHEVVLVTPKRNYRQSVFTFFHLPPALFSHVVLPVADPLSWSWFPWKRLAYVLQRASFFFSLRRWSRDKTADIWYSRDAAVIDALRDSAHRRFVLELHDDPERLKKRWRKIIPSSILGFVMITRALKQELAGLGIDERKMIVAPDGYDPNDFLISGNREETRRLWGVPSGAFVLLYVGGLYPWKGVDIPVVCWAQTPAPAHLVIIGGPKADQDRLRTFVPTAVQDRVHFFEAVPHEMVVRLFAGADAGLLSGDFHDAHSACFTSPLKLFEYLAAGLPIVAADLPSAREILTDTVARFYAPTASAFVEAVRKAMNDRVWYVFAQKEAQTLVDPFSWGKRCRLIAQWMDDRLSFALENDSC